MQEGGLIRSFAAMNGQVARVYAQTKWDGVQFPEFNAAAGRFLQFRDHPVAHPALKGIGCRVPAKQAEAEQAESAEEQEQISQNAAARWGNRRLAQRFPSPALDSGVRMWLPERRLANQPESSSFIFCSASQSLIRPESSGKGVARLPARFIVGSN